MVRLAKIGKGSINQHEEREELGEPHSSFYSLRPDLAPEQDEHFYRADQYIAKHSISELFNVTST
jgi:hypothetical protein